MNLAGHAVRIQRDSTNHRFQESFWVCRFSEDSGYLIVGDACQGGASRGVLIEVGDLLRHQQSLSLEFLDLLKHRGRVFQHQRQFARSLDFPVQFGKLPT